MRTIRINGVKCELSKSEANFVSHSTLLKEPQKRHMYLQWLRDSPSLEAKDRRQYIVNTLYPPVAA